jgi:hypothetical protein
MNQGGNTNQGQMSMYRARPTDSQGCDLTICNSTVCSAIPGVSVMSCGDCDTSVSCGPGSTGFCNMLFAGYHQLCGGQGLMNRLGLLGPEESAYFRAAPVLLPSGSVSATLTVNKDINQIPDNSPSRGAFKQGFKADVAHLLGNISTARVMPLSISPGSVMVDFAIVPSAARVPLPVSQLNTPFSSPAVLLINLGVMTTTAVASVRVQPASVFEYTKIFTDWKCQTWDSEGRRRDVNVLMDVDSVTVDECTTACTAMGSGCLGVTFLEEPMVMSCEDEDNQCTEITMRCSLVVENFNIEPDSYSPSNQRYYGDTYARGDPCPARSGMPAFSYSADQCQPCGAGEFSPAYGYGPCSSVCMAGSWGNADTGVCELCPATTTSVAGATAQTECANCAAKYYRMNSLCVECPEENGFKSKLSLVVALALPPLVGLVMFCIAGGAELDENNAEHLAQSNRDTALDAATQVASLSTFLSLLFQSFQFSMLTWNFSVGWPDWMKSLTAWISNLAMPDVSGFTALECDHDTGGDPAGVLVAKFFQKQLMFLFLLLLYASMWQFAPSGQMQRRALQSLAASFSIMFMM